MRIAKLTTKNYYCELRIAKCEINDTPGETENRGNGEKQFRIAKCEINELKNCNFELRNAKCEINHSIILF
jgi:hypothetical protein